MMFKIFLTFAVRSINVLLQAKDGELTKILVANKGFFDVVTFKFFK